MAQDILSIINDSDGDTEFKAKGKGFLFYSTLKSKIKTILMKILRKEN